MSDDNLQELDSIYADIESAINSEAEAIGDVEVVDEPTVDEAEPVVDSDEPEVDEAEQGSGEPEEDEVATPEADPEVEKARADGWRPKEEFSGDPNEWVDAAEFNRRKPLFAQMSKQNKKIKDLERTLESVANYQKSLEEKTRQKVIAEFEAKKRKAVEYGDVDAYEQATQEQKEFETAEEAKEPEEKDEPEEVKTNEPPKEVMDIVQDFAAKNTWFEKDEDMTAVMLNRVQKLVTSGTQFKDAVEKASEHVRSLFPDKFTNPKRAKPAKVVSGQRGAQGSSPKVSINSLTDQQRDVLRYYKQNGIMTEQEFLKSLE